MFSYLYHYLISKLKEWAGMLDMPYEIIADNPVYFDLESISRCSVFLYINETVGSNSMLSITYYMKDEYRIDNSKDTVGWVSHGLAIDKDKSIKLGNIRIVVDVEEYTDLESFDSTTMPLDTIYIVRVEEGRKYVAIHNNKITFLD